MPGLIIAEHNLDGVYPGDESRAIDFLLEAKMMGTPKHANSPGHFAAVVRWAETAAQVVDAVGLYCYEFVPGSYTDYRPKTGIQPAYQLDRVLYRACTDLKSLKEAPPPPVIFDVPPSAAAGADELTDEAISRSPEG